MANWAWIALGLGLLVLIQLVAIQYARRLGSDESEATPRATSGRGSESRPIPEPDPAGSTDQVVCTNCGETNDPLFTFCRECVSPLA